MYDVLHNITKHTISREIDQFIQCILNIDGRWCPELQELIQSRYTEEGFRDALRCFQFTEKHIEQLVTHSSVAYEYLDKKYLTPKIERLHKLKWSL